MVVILGVLTAQVIVGISVYVLGRMSGNDAAFKVVVEEAHSKIDEGKTEEARILIDVLEKITKNFYKKG